VEHSNSSFLTPRLGHPADLVRIIREGAESGVWGDEIAPKMIVAA
jgi:hypothetical protein